jgi:hypothetical protein
MPSSTKMSIPYPASTDLVKDGATNMGSMATQIDAKTGLVLIGTTSFSAVSSQNVTSVFSANYTNYRIMLSAIGSTTVQNVTLRLLLATTPNSAANYRRQILDAGASTPSATRTPGDTNWRLGRVFSTNKQMAWADMFFPFETAKTQFWNFNASQTDGDILWTSEACSLDVTTSYDGFQLNVASGTITGSVSVYGYNI